MFRPVLQLFLCGVIVIPQNIWLIDLRCSCADRHRYYCLFPQRSNYHSRHRLRLAHLLGPMSIVLVTHCAASVINVSLFELQTRVTFCDEELAAWHWLVQWWANIYIGTLSLSWGWMHTTATTTTYTRCRSSDGWRQKSSEHAKLNHTFNALMNVFYDLLLMCVVRKARRFWRRLRHGWYTSGSSLHDKCWTFRLTVLPILCMHMMHSL